MGLDPYRQQKKTPFDVVMVFGAIALTLGVLAWAMFGG
jgi:hypothetical protein